MLLFHLLSFFLSYLISFSIYLSLYLILYFQCLPSTLYNASLSITLTCVINNSPPSKQLSDVFKVGIYEIKCSRGLLKKSLIILQQEQEFD